MVKANSSISWISVVLLAICAYWGITAQIPSEDYLDSENPSDFSIERAMSHLQVISKDIHYVGTPYHKEVQSYLVEELRSLGLDPQIQQDRVFRLSSRSTTGTSVENIVAEIKGSGTGKALMLMAHYDSGLADSYGASDDGAGIATILEALRVFLAKNEQPKNDIIVLFSDAEEIGLMGARAFVEKNPLAEKVGLVLNFEARGSGGPSYMLMETNGKNGKLLKEFMKANPGYPTCNSLAYSVYKMLPNDTDLTPLREISNINGFNFAFLDDHFDYHTAQDRPERLDRASLVHQADYLMSSLNYFAFSNLDDFEDEEDRTFVNLPFVKLLHYPASWNKPLWGLAFLLIIGFLFFGVKMGKISLKNGLKSFLPFLLALIANCVLTFGLWRLILLIHPSFTDILSGFTYNGYYYQGAFMVLNIWLSLFVYQKWLSKYEEANLLIGPMILWLILNAAMILGLPGGSFLLIPVFFAIGMFAISIFSNLSPNVKQILYVLLSLPAIYLLSPIIRLLPVALGLGLTAIGTFFLVALFGLLTPIFSLAKNLTYLKYGSGAIAVILFAIATSMSGYNEDRRKPNNINFFYHADQNISYWGSANKDLDPFLTQFFGDQPEKGNLPAEANFRHPMIKMYAKTENHAVKVSEIILHQDSLRGDNRFIEFSISPQRDLDMISLIAEADLKILEMTVNGSLVSSVDYEGTTFEREKGQYLLNYFMSHADKDLLISVLTENKPFSFYIREISNDLLSNELFDIKARADYMMPMQFIGDSFITKKTISW